MYRKEPLISIITINYNSINHTLEFLESAKKLNYTNYEIIVVDNASFENPLQKISKFYPNVKVIVSANNLGFSGGNNFGIKQAKGEYYFLVNNDTILNENILKILVSSFYEFENVGIVSPKIKFHDKPNLIQYAGFEEVNSLTGRNRAIGYMQLDDGLFDSPNFTAYAHGAAMLLSKKLVLDIGLLPDIYFLYYEELDYSLSARKAGYNVLYQPKAYIYHKESSTVGRSSNLKIYFQNRNRMLFMRRHFNKSYFVFMVYMIFFVITKNILISIIKLDFKVSYCYFKALKWNFFVPPYYTK